MANSVNTNFGASVALQSLNKTNRELDTVQKRISTGFKVADAKDDGAAFGVAQGLRAKVKGNEAAQERLSSAKGLLTVTQESLKGISDTIGSLKAVTVKLGDASLSDDERTQYEADYTALVADITSYISGSTFNGKSLINEDAEDLAIASDSDGTALTLTASVIETDDIETAPTDADGAVDMLADLDTFAGTINTALAQVGADSRSVDNKANFLSVLNDATNDGIGAIVDADLAKESAKLQALQIRQQLGTQALSIANQAPSAILSLFK